VNARWQTQELNKSVNGAEAGSGPEQFMDYKDRWNVCASPLSSSTGHQDASGHLPHPQPSCSVWTDRFESAWKNDASSVVQPWWNGSNDKWIAQSGKLLSDPSLSVDQQHSAKCGKVRTVTCVVEIMLRAVTKVNILL